jgi:hypothetical protein
MLAARRSSTRHGERVLAIKRGELSGEPNANMNGTLSKRTTPDIRRGSLLTASRSRKMAGSGDWN